MKTRFTLSLLLALCLAQIKTVEANNPAYGTNVPAPETDWQKVKKQSWPGVVSEQLYWYKLDAAGTLWISPDGKNWELDADSMWTDKEGSFYKLGESKLTWSPDGGNTWFDAPESKWLAADGNWYKLDKNRAVWFKKAE